MKDEKPKIIGSYEPNSFCAGQIIDSDGIAPTFLENHGSIMAIIEREDDNVVKLLGGIGEKSLMVEQNGINKIVSMIVIVSLLL